LPLLAGVFGAGGVIAFAIGGDLLLPATVGSLLGIGMLGFTPWFSGGVYWRYASLAYVRAAPFAHRRNQARWQVAAGVAASLLGPLLIALILNHFGWQIPQPHGPGEVLPTTW